MVLLDINDLIVGVGGIVFFVLYLILILIVQIFSLKIGINAVKGKSTTMSSVFITGLINFVAMFLLIFFIPLFGWLIAIIVGLLIIKIRHETTFFGALGAVIISWIIIIILIIVIAMLIGTTLNVLLGYLLP
jgi:hypothetical protein